MKFVTVEMAKELTNRFANSPKIKRMMEEVYHRALLGCHEISFSPSSFTRDEKNMAQVFFIGMGYKVEVYEGIGIFKISW